MRVLLHLGFPKTGSSTIQFGPLMELEQAGSLCLKTWRKKADTEVLELRPSSCLFQNRRVGAEYLNFSKKLLNVLSDESLTAPLRLRRQNFGDDICDPFSFPSVLKSQILEKYPAETVKFKCLVVIREQSQLIASQYVEEFNWKRYQNIDLLFNEIGDLDLSGYEVYRFSSYLEVLESVFGRENCIFLLYEDMKYNLECFSSELDRAFGAKSGFFMGALRKHHVNGKKKSKYGTFTKDGGYFIPSLHDEVLSDIRLFFRESNMGLNKYFPEDKLARYRYINA